jgi:cell division protein FtsL
MATLATIFDRFFTARAADQAASRAHEDEDPNRLRYFPNEDVYFFVKKIDNTQVVRESDPAARNTCWRVIGSCVSAAVLLIAVFLPSLYTLIAGYQLESLRQEQQHLEIERSSLQLQESRLMSPQRLEELARQQQFIDPAPAKVVYLDGKPEGTLAQSLTKHIGGR